MAPAELSKVSCRVPKMIETLKSWSWLAGPYCWFQCKEITSHCQISLPGSQELALCCYVGMNIMSAL